MSINLRKLLCPLFRKGGWLYRLFDCKRYEKPQETIVVNRSVVTENVTSVTKYQLHPDFHRHTAGVIYSPFFAKCGLINRSEYTTQDFKDFIDEVAKHNLANCMRSFMYGVWMPGEFTSQVVHFPHPKRDGKFVLEEINQEWLNQLIDRVGYVIDRGITYRLIQDDECQLHHRHFEAWHWLYDQNNCGWYGKPTYFDKYGWTKWVHLSNPNFGNEDERRRYETTGEYIRWFYHYILDQLLQRFDPKYLIFEHNEIDAGAIWHDYKASLYDSYGIPRNNRITSVRGYEWFKSKPNIPNRFIPSVHEIGSMRSYLDKESYLRGDEDGGSMVWPWLPSGDGYGDDWYENPDDLRELVRRILADGNEGICGNNWLPNSCDFRQLDWQSSRIIRDVVIEWLS